jgi:ABC-type antimicrobial peptide transport system permease subunit
LARRLFPGRSALGQPVRRLNQDGSLVTLFDPAARESVAVPPFTIVGIVRDVREVSLRGPAAETVYIPMVTPAVERSIIPTDATLVIRTTVPPETIAELVRHTLSESHPDVGVGRIRAMGAIVADARAREAFVGTLLLLAAGIAVCLGATGIYGSVAEVVRRRRREIGIRVALGSDASAVVRLVSRGSLRSTIVGAALGTVIALASGRALGALLFGVRAADPFTIAAATGVLFAAAALAALGAAWRATRIAPLTALRED